MKFGVVTFPGSNCDDDIVYILKDVLHQEVVNLWHKDTDLKGAEFIVLPGGFSYGDYLRSGAIAKLSPIMQSVVEHANEGGYVLGICNGFQILTESGLLEGALLQNDHQKFVCNNVYLRPANNTTLITKDLDKDRAYKIPIAHGEGRFFASDETIKQLTDEDRVIFRYCGEDGTLGEMYNPNGSVGNIAGICNKGRNVFGMMPHPERAADAPLGNEDGKLFFQSILNNL